MTKACRDESGRRRRPACSEMLRLLIIRNILDIICVIGLYIELKCKSYLHNMTVVLVFFSIYLRQIAIWWTLPQAVRAQQGLRAPPAGDPDGERDPVHAGLRVHEAAAPGDGPAGRLAVAGRGAPHVGGRGGVVPVLEDQVVGEFTRTRPQDPSVPREARADVLPLSSKRRPSPAPTTPCARLCACSTSTICGTCRRRPRCSSPSTCCWCWTRRSTTLPDTSYPASRWPHTYR